MLGIQAPRKTRRTKSRPVSSSIYRHSARESSAEGIVYENGECVRELYAAYNIRRVHCTRRTRFTTRLRGSSACLRTCDIQARGKIVYPGQGTATTTTLANYNKSLRWPSFNHIYNVSSMKKKNSINRRI